MSTKFNLDTMSYVPSPVRGHSRWPLFSWDSPLLSECKGSIIMAIVHWDSARVFAPRNLPGPCARKLGLLLLEHHCPDLLFIKHI